MLHPEEHPAEHAANKKILQTNLSYVMFFRSLLLFFSFSFSFSLFVLVCQQ